MSEELKTFFSLVDKFEGPKKELFTALLNDFIVYQQNIFDSLPLNLGTLSNDDATKYLVTTYGERAHPDKEIYTRHTARTGMTAVSLSLMNNTGLQAFVSTLLRHRDNIEPPTSSDEEEMEQDV